MNSIRGQRPQRGGPVHLWTGNHREKEEINNCGGIFLVQQWAGPEWIDFDPFSCDFAPDGTALVFFGEDKQQRRRLQYATITLRGREVSITPRFVLPQAGMVRLYEHGLLFNGDKLYDEHGQGIQASDSWHFNSSEPISLETYTFAKFGEQGPVEIFSLARRQRWRIPQTGVIDDMAISRDGEYVATLETGPYRPPRLLALAGQLAPSWLEQ